MSMLREQQPKSEKEEKQRLRNCSAQRAFRKRRAEQFKVLREQANAASRYSSNEHTRTVEDENRRLREEIRLLKSHVQEVQSKLRSIQDSCSQILRSESDTTSCEAHRSPSPGKSRSGHVRVEAEHNKQPCPEAGAFDNAYATPKTLLPTENRGMDLEPHEEFFAALPNASVQPQEAQVIGEPGNLMSWSASDLTMAFCSRPTLYQDRSSSDQAFWLSPSAHISKLFPTAERIAPTESIGGIAQPEDMIMQSSFESQSNPQIWNPDYQVGSHSHFNIAELSNPPRNSWLETNSPISDHIEILKTILREKIGQSNNLNISTNTDEAISWSTCHPLPLYTTLYQSTSTALALFNSMTRPDVMKWYAKTKFFHIVELTAWQILPCGLTYRRLHQRYRPTALQLALCGQYPCVVDWIPFASVRDRIIESHAANPSVDRIFCDTVSAYVVETTLSALVIGGSSMRVFIRVTDLIAAMALPPTEGDSIDSPTLPAPSIQSLLSSPEYARQAFKKLNMDRGASYYKIDPEFFGKYPELYDASEDITASGIPIKLGLHQTLTSSKPVNLETVETYRSFIDFSFDAVQAMSRSLEDSPTL